ncbi:hypothetical protein CEP52_006462 [Fusarium oligoseptatum]|uniref:protein S-acyltransferase n=1 Tax=Fusarium oligoseptatum TaxID=2604345 RepID=A0A428TSR4_9HYPO|nr:hypothetical protein CEP52_006462 [Fusarium oligoseptatum]
MSNLYARQGREMDLDFRRAARGADKTLRDLGGFTAAHYACQSGCPKMIRLFIEKKVALDTQATDGTFPMHLAVETGNHNVVKILLENKNGTDADQRPRDFDGRMPVHYAAAGGHALIVRMLKADIDAQDDSGWTALHMAALAEKKFLIKMLYELSADGEVKDKMGRTPLVLACSEGRWGAVGELVNAGATVDEKDSDGMTVFHHLAIKGASSALISTIVEGLDGTDIRRLINSQDPGGRTPLYIAAGTRNRDTVHGLIQAGADVTMIGGGRLDFMASKGHLIRKGTGEDIPMRTPWSYVLSARALADRSKLGIFLTHMENLYKSQGREMRFVFSRAGHRPELPPWFDFTALYEKAARGHMIDSDEFRKLRIFFNVRDICGLTPLLYAAGTKNCQLIDQLLNMGADPTLADFQEDVSRMTILSIGYPDFNYNKEHISNTYPG